MSPTPRLTGAGARSAEGTNAGHENAEGIASVGIRVEPTVSRHSAHLVKAMNSVTFLVLSFRA